MSSKERPTLGGTRIKTRKRNITAPADTAGFAGSVVQIYLDSAGNLESVAKIFESSDLNFQRYGDTFFEILFTGGRTQPGTIRQYEGAQHGYSILACQPARDCVEPYIVHIQKILQRKAFLIKNLENVIQKLLQSLELFKCDESKNLAIFVALALSSKLLQPDVVFQPLLKDHLVAKGLVLSFITNLFKEFLACKSLDELVLILKQGRKEQNLLDFFPPSKRSPECFSEHFTNEGLTPLVAYYEKKALEMKLSEMKEAVKAQISADADVSEVIEFVKQQAIDAQLPAVEVVRSLWDVVMVEVLQVRKNQQQNAIAALQQAKTWAKLLNKFCDNGNLELELMYKAQLQCHEDVSLLKLFPDLIRVLYLNDVLAEDTIVYWYMKGTVVNGRENFVKSLEPFVEWLKEAEEED